MMGEVAVIRDVLSVEERACGETRNICCVCASAGY